MNEITITQPDDWHIHLRDGAALSHTVPDIARIFARAVVMPNLNPPLVNTDLILGYRDRILTAVPENTEFQPLMTLYLTDHSSGDEMIRAKDSGAIIGAKLYPAGVTTHAESGVSDIRHIEDTLAVMEEVGLVLQLHGEDHREETDIFDRERVFLQETLPRIVDKYPRLRIVFEHITTADAVAFILSAPDNVAATITPHHLLANRNDLLASGIRPHLYCLPVLKTEEDRIALLEAATSGHPRFFLGTDSAPHPISAKESPCGCAGIYTAPTALELYAEAFEQVDALHRLEGFASFHGADFYGLTRNTRTVVLHRSESLIPEVTAFGEDEVVPFRGGSSVAWTAACGPSSHEGE